MTVISPFIIPIFITHQGCPHRCIFCNQESISGSEEGAYVNESQVRQEIVDCLKRPGAVDRQVQVAFYGGSFTGLPSKVQKNLLRAVRPFIDAKTVHSIRLSTRPDYIDESTADFLFAHGVKTVELGIQSLDENVLHKSRRGHSAADVKNAFVHLKKSSIKIGGQLMVGLPGETVRGVLQGAKLLSDLRPDFVRIYPTLVVKGSGLEKLYEQRKYKPLSLLRAVAMTVKMKRVFDEEKIQIIRMGLQHSDELENNIVEGPYHPAFGELVKAREFYLRTRSKLRELSVKTHKKIYISSKDRSIFGGQKNCSIKKLTELGLLEGVEVFFENSQPRGEIKVELA